MLCFKCSYCGFVHECYTISSTTKYGFEGTHQLLKNLTFVANKLHEDIMLVSRSFQFKSVIIEADKVK